MSDSSSGPGWWQASDGQWYPPELHPSLAETAVREAPDTAAPQRRTWSGRGGRGEGAASGRRPKPLYRRVWFIALAAVVGLLVAVVISPGKKSQGAGATAPPAIATSTASVVTTTTTLTTPTSSIAPTATTVPTAASGGETCTATISNAVPGIGSDETIRVTSNVPNTAVTATIYYETSTAQYPGRTDGSGNATIAFGIGQATVGDTVTITVIVGTGATCTTSFTPQ